MTTPSESEPSGPFITPPEKLSVAQAFEESNSLSLDIAIEPASSSTAAASTETATQARMAHLRRLLTRASLRVGIRNAIAKTDMITEMGSGSYGTVVVGNKFSRIKSIANHVIAVEFCDQDPLPPIPWVEEAWGRAGLVEDGPTPLPPLPASLSHLDRVMSIKTLIHHRSPFVNA